VISFNAEKLFHGLKKDTGSQSIRLKKQNRACHQTDIDLFLFPRASLTADKTSTGKELKLRFNSDI